RPRTTDFLRFLSAGGGRSVSDSFAPPFLGGDPEGGSFGNVGTRALRAWGGAGRQGRPGRDVEVRVQDRRPNADARNDDQEGRGQTRRDDDLAGPEGGEAQGRETEGQHSDVFRRAEVHGQRVPPRFHAQDRRGQVQGESRSG